MTRKKWASTTAGEAVQGVKRGGQAGLARQARTTRRPPAGVRRFSTHLTTTDKALYNGRTSFLL